MAKYNVGDKVIIRGDLVSGKRYGDNSFISGMTKFLGKTATIKSIVANGQYKLVEDPGNWSWTNEMILRKYEENLEINIKADNKKITATVFVNGEVVATGVARCHPDDRFDFGYGSYLAYTRAMENYRRVSKLVAVPAKETKKPIEQKITYKAGDKVIITGGYGEYHYVPNGEVVTVTDVNRFGYVTVDFLVQHVRFGDVRPAKKMAKCIKAYDRSVWETGKTYELNESGRVINPKNGGEIEFRNLIGKWEIVFG